MQAKLFSFYLFRGLMNNLSALRLLTILFLMGTMCPLLQAAQQKKITGPVTYQEIGNAYISSFGIVEDAKPILVEEKNGKKKLNLTPPSLSENEKRQIVFELMARNEKTEQGNPMLDEATRVLLKDMDFYYGSGENTKETFISKIKNTVTIFGETALVHSLAHPTTDLTSIKQRQALIKAFIDSPILMQDVDKILHQVKQAESGFLSYFVENDPLSNELLKNLYFPIQKLQFLNKNAKAMEALVRLRNAGTGLNLSGDLIVAMILEYIVTRSFKKALKGPFSLGKYVLQSMETVGGPRLKYGYAILYLGMKGYGIKVILEEALQQKNSINYLQTRLIDVGTIVRALEKLRGIVVPTSGYNAAAILKNPFKAIEAYQKNTQFNELVQSLNTNTFKGKASFFSRSGKILAANAMMIDQKKHFSNALEALGEIDACLSMAKLYKKMQHERVKYSFVEFIDAPTPSINITNYWNPFIDPKVVVTNSLQLGHGTDASRIILTGSNTGGKSTNLKAILTCLWLGHTYGLAPADSCIITPFTLIGCYFPKGDDIAAGESKFKAEVMRAKLLCETLESLGDHQFAFMVMDELFTGTNATDSKAAAKKVAEKLASLPNNLFIFATHIPELTVLEAEHPGLYKNYKVDVYKDANGKLVYPYTLVPGISNSNIANDILNEQIHGISF